MPAITSGTTLFSMDVDEMINDALKPLGGGSVSAADMVDYRRALNLILIKLQNKNIPLSKYGSYELPLLQNVASYMLPVDVVDVLHCTVNEGSIDLEISREGLKEYNAMPKKDQLGLPNLFVTNRERDQVKVTFWPVPKIDMVAKMLVSRKVEDITAAYQKIDINTRYYPLLLSWLTYDLSFIRVGVPAEKMAEARVRFNEILPDTFEEDRERVDMHIRIDGVSAR